MDQSLFTIPLTEITLDRIREFCGQRIPEGARVDYKQDLNKEQDKILRTITAMANTDGGLILVGVEEEKEKGGRRSFPGEIKGVDTKNPRQIIISWCHAFIQPVYCPEILEISLNDSGKVVVLIRIECEEVPSLPLFCREKGILIRLDEENHLADTTRIKLLLEESIERENKARNDFSYWLNHRIPNREEFCWCTIGINLPMKRFTGRLSWNSNQIYQLKKVIDEHQVGCEQIWLNKWCPLLQEIGDRDLAIKRRDQQNIAKISGSTISLLVLKRHQQGVQFRPDPIYKRRGSPVGMKEPNPKNGGWFGLWFDARGFFLGSIGIPWGPTGTIKGEEFCAAMYSLLDVLKQKDIKELYPDCLWEGGQFEIFAKVDQFPGKVEISSDEVEYPLEFCTRGSSWSGPHETEIIDAIMPEKLAKTYTDRFLAWAGFMNYEEYLEGFGVLDYLSRY